jgi:dihydrofolate synthase/folylpolyglutamate synthase
MAAVSDTLTLGVGRLSAVLSALGHPEASFAVVHVAGTNGKGSVCALVESCLRVGAGQAAGLG